MSKYYEMEVTVTVKLYHPMWELLARCSKPEMRGTEKYEVHTSFPRQGKRI